MTEKEFRLKIRMLENLRETARNSGSEYMVTLYTGIIKAHKEAYYGQFRYSLTPKGKQFQEGRRHGR